MRGGRGRYKAWCVHVLKVLMKGAFRIGGLQLARQACTAWEAGLAPFYQGGPGGTPPPRLLPVNLTKKIDQLRVARYLALGSQPSSKARGILRERNGVVPAAVQPPCLRQGQG